MYAQVEKPKENKSRAVANSVGQKKGNVKQGFAFTDNRAEIVSRKVIQLMANSHSTQKSFQNKTTQKSEIITRKNQEIAQLSKLEKIKDGVSSKTVAKGSLLGVGLNLVGYGMLGSHPIGWIVGGFLAGIAGTTLFSYFDGIDPDPKKLEGIADRLGMTEEELIDHWNTSQPNPDAMYDYVNTIPEIHEQQQRLTSMVPPSMIANLEGNNVQRLGIIFQRLNNMNFNYSGQSVGPEIGYLIKSGDCLTLANMFVLAAQAANINGVTVIPHVASQIVLPRPIHGRTKQGNTEQQDCWFFENHYWCNYNGNIYDLLFMTKHQVLSYDRVRTKKYYGCKYDVFANGYCMISFGEAANELKKQYQSFGLCKKNEAEIKEYIKKIKDPK